MLRRPPRHAALVLALACAGPAHAQGLLDWPIRATAGPAALSRGAEAVMWNPAAIRPAAARFEALVVDVAAPPAIGLDGISVAAAGRLTPRTALGAAYTHRGVDGIPHTTTSPSPDAARPDLAVGEDEVGLAAARRIGAGLDAGALVRYTRYSVLGRHDDWLGYGVGLVYSAGLPLRPSLAGTALVEPDRVRWTAGLSAASPPIGEAGWTFAAGYGLSGGSGPARPVQRATARLGWGNRLALSLGLTGEPEPRRTVWVPVVGGRITIDRYTLAILREQLPNRFEASYHYALLIRF